MKTNTFTATLSIILSGLLAFFISFYASEDGKVIITICSFVSFLITLIGLTSVSLDDKRKNWSARLISMLFFIVILAAQLVFISLSGFILQAYFLVTGGIIIIYLLVMYALLSADLK
jgi:O-antigen/teichoic acid export membrane protein